MQDSQAGPAGLVLHGGLELPLDPGSEGETGEGPSEVARELVFFLTTSLTL